MVRLLGVFLLRLWFVVLGLSPHLWLEGGRERQLQEEELRDLRAERRKDAPGKREGWWSRVTSRVGDAAIAVARVGRVPRHVAFIMDGNRRFSRARGLGRVEEGHERGFEALERCLESCMRLGIREVSVYAFSVHNFGRAPAEVQALMRLMRERLEYLLTKSPLIHKHRIAICVVGELRCVPEELREVIARAMRETRGYTGARLNVAFAYSSRLEMQAAADALRASVERGSLRERDVDAKAFARALWIPDSPQLLIRTSGETRLSDFMLWQTGASVHLVSPAMWPEFSLRHLLLAVFAYQRLAKK